MSLRVAFDMDGTVADMQAVLRLEAARLFGARAEEAMPTPDPSPDDEPFVAPLLESVSHDLSLTTRQQALLWERVTQIENFWTTLPEQEPGIIARIAHVARHRRWEVLFITTRPSSAGETTQVQTQRWLETHGFRLPSVFVVRRSRGKLAAALQLDAVVDDRPENCLDVAVDSKARPLLVWPGPPASVPAGLDQMGVRAVSCISDALALLERMDDRRKSPAVMRSIRRVLKRDPLD